MTSKVCADPTFGINPQALAVMTLLVAREADFAPWNKVMAEYNTYVRTFPWYSGRVAGVAFVVYRENFPGGPCLVVAVFEHASSDDIVVQSWESPDQLPWGPTVANREALGEAVVEAARANQRIFKVGRIGDAADHVFERMRDFYQTQPVPTAMERILEDDD